MAETTDMYERGRADGAAGRTDRDAVRNHEYQRGHTEGRIDRIEAEIVKEAPVLRPPHG